MRLKVDAIDQKAELGNLWMQNKEDRVLFMKEIMQLKNIKLKDLKQKAKVKWASKFDENSKFFHGMISDKLRFSRIHGLSIGGSWVHNPQDIKHHIFDFYNRKFEEHDCLRPNFTSMLFKTL